MVTPMDSPTVLYVDNQGAEALAKDRKSCQRSRHIERRYLKAREWVANGDIRCVYVPTDQNPADMLTKSLELAAFSSAIARLLVEHQQWPLRMRRELALHRLLLPWIR